MRLELIFVRKAAVMQNPKVSWHFIITVKSVKSITKHPKMLLKLLVERAPQKSFGFWLYNFCLFLKSVEHTQWDIMLRI